MMEHYKPFIPSLESGSIKLDLVRLKKRLKLGLINRSPYEKAI